MGRRSLYPILAGRFTWQRTAAVVAAAALIDASFYVLTHAQVWMRTSAAFFLAHLLDFAYICAIAPVAEEVAFQAYVQTRLQRLGVLPALFLTTCLFVIAHFGTFKYDLSFSAIERLFATLFLPLFVLAIVRQFTGSLLAAVAVHALDNLVVFFTSAT